MRVGECKSEIGSKSRSRIVPRACPQIIDKYIHAHQKDEGISFIEHESGPEVLAYVLVAAGVINLSASVINFITAIIKARSEGIKQGDYPSHPIELIVRGFGKDGKLKDEKILTFHAHDKVDARVIKAALLQSFEEKTPDKSKKKRPSK